jgi:hypothetical protein
MTRLRVVGWRVQPILMADDGEHLTPLTVDGQVIHAAAWDAFKAGGDEEALSAIREQIEHRAASAPKEG